VMARVRCRNGAVESVAFRNVPSFVVARGVWVADTEVDIAYGGALYAFVSADSVGVRVDPADLSELIKVGRGIKRALEGHELARHPSDDRLSGIYGTVVHEEVGPLHLRNVAIFADGEVDRSPTGSATSARSALLLDDGTLSQGQTWRNDSIIGTTFHARAIGSSDEGVLTEVEGMAYRTGDHRFVFTAGDPLGTGFVLR
jgi:proline racemase